MKTKKWLWLLSLVWAGMLPMMANVISTVKYPITVDKDSYVVGALTSYHSLGKADFCVTAICDEGLEFTVLEGEEWLGSYVAKGSDNRYFITYKLNSTGNERLGRILVSNVSRTDSITLSVRQLATPLVYLEEREYIVQSQEATFDIKYDASYEMIPDESWCEWITAIESGEEGILRLQVTPSEENEMREGQIMLNIADDRYFVTVKQMPKGTASFSEQKQALIDLYNATNGDNWNNNENWLTDSPLDEWYGVSTNKGGYLTSVNLFNNNLEGVLPESFAKLMDIPVTGSLILARLLAVQANHLHGKVPETVKAHKAYPQYAWGLLRQYRSIDKPFLDVADMDLFIGHDNISLLDRKYTTVDEVLNKNEFTLYVSFEQDIYNKYPNDSILNLYFDYRNKGLGVVVLIEPTVSGAEEDWEYWKSVAQNMPEGITWVRKQFGNISSANSSFVITNEMCLIDNVGQIIEYITPTNTDKIVDDSWYMKRLRELIAQELGEPAYHEPYGYNLYTSSDYSRDGEVIVLQEATVGRGIDFVFLGDAFVDRDMGTGGKYEIVMQNAMEAMFAFEPFKSFRNRFNVYTVKVVSQNEFVHDGAIRRINEDRSICAEYVEKIPGIDLNKTTIIDVVNNPTGESFENVRNDESVWGYAGLNWGPGGYCVILKGRERGPIAHEVSHAFAGLGDQAVGDAPFSNEEAKQNFRELQNLGYKLNISLSNNPSEVPWKHFFQDERYKELVGIYEGADYCSSGVYRSSEEQELGPFNAICRELIYKAIMQASEGDDWVYSFEDFAEYDVINRAKGNGYYNYYSVLPVLKEWIDNYREKKFGNQLFQYPMSVIEMLENSIVQAEENTDKDNAYENLSSVWSDWESTCRMNIPNPADKYALRLANTDLYLSVSDGTVRLSQQHDNTSTFNILSSSTNDFYLKNQNGAYLGVINDGYDYYLTEDMELNTRNLLKFTYDSNNDAYVLNKHIGAKMGLAGDIWPYYAYLGVCVGQEDAKCYLYPIEQYNDPFGKAWYEDVEEMQYWILEPVSEAASISLTSPITFLNMDKGYAHAGEIVYAVAEVENTGDNEYVNAKGISARLAQNGNPHNYFSISTGLDTLRVPAHSKATLIMTGTKTTVGTYTGKVMEYNEVMGNYLELDGNNETITVDVKAYDDYILRAADIDLTATPTKGIDHTLYMEVYPYGTRLSGAVTYTVVQNKVEIARNEVTSKSFDGWATVAFTDEELTGLKQGLADVYITLTTSGGKEYTAYLPMTVTGDFTDTDPEPEPNPEPDPEPDPEPEPELEWVDCSAYLGNVLSSLEWKNDQTFVGWHNMQIVELADVLGEYLGIAFENWCQTDESPAGRGLYRVIDVPNGTYRITAAIMAQQQDGAGNQDVEFYANEKSVNCYAPVSKYFTIDSIVVQDGRIELGIRMNSQYAANWVAIADMKLYSLEEVKEEEPEPDPDPSLEDYTVYLGNPLSAKEWYNDQILTGWHNMQAIELLDAAGEYLGVAFENWCQVNESPAGRGLYRTIDVPNGTYRLTAAIMAQQQDGSGNQDVEFYANDKAVNCYTLSSKYFTIDEIVVYEGKMELGIRMNSKFAANWVAIADMKLYYLGYDQDAIDKYIDKDFIEAMGELRGVIDMFIAEYETKQNKVSTAGRLLAKRRIKDAEARYESITTVEECKEYITVVKDQLHSFLLTQLPPADFTFALINPDFTDSSEGWDGTPTVDYDVAEVYNRTFDVSQELTDMPSGTYTLTVSGFYRYGGDGPAVGEEARLNGQEELNALLYANEESVSLISVFDEASSILYAGDEVPTGFGYVPNTMYAASVWFQKGMYANNTLKFVITDGTVRLGIKKDVAVDKDWTIFTGFKLNYDSKTTVGITDVENEEVLKREYYSFDGRKINQPTEGYYLERILYSNGKVVVKKILFAE